MSRWSLRSAARCNEMQWLSRGLQGEGEKGLGAEVNTESRLSGGIRHAGALLGGLSRRL